MKERVELNNNGRSIESHCKLFENRKWEPRYIVCKLHCDLEEPLLTFYKNRKDRQKDKAKLSLQLRNYIGFEKSFPLKNKNQTLTVITKDFNIVLAFHLAETLLQWETWFKNVGGQSTVHYMQLLQFPNQKENPTFINREVRCHLHDSRLAIVFGIPAETLLYCEVAAATIAPDHLNHRVTITPHNGDGEFVLCCPSIDFFAKLLKKANEDDGSLNLYLNKKNAEGVWLHNISNRTRRHQDSISGLSGTFSGWFNFMSPTTPSINQSEMFSSRAAINTVGIRNPGMKTPVGSLKFLNGLLPERNSSPQPLIAAAETPVINPSQFSESPVLTSTNENSPHLGSDAKQRSTSLPEYVNVQHVIRRSPDVSKIEKNRHEVIQRKASTMTTPARESPRFSNCGEHRQFMPSRIHPKGRSMMDFSTLPFEESGTRHESWRRAKKFISAFTPKSHQDIYKSATKNTKNFKKSSSTSALVFSPIESKTSLATTSSSSELDEIPPPALNVAVTNPAPPLLPRKEKENENIPAGLVRLREEGSLKVRGGVNIALARRLAAGINGSFTKYDGDRGTHVYPQTPEEKERKIEEFIEERRRTALSRRVESPDFSNDPLASVVSKERDKLRQLERRASSVSFNKTNAVQLAHLNEIQKKALASVTIHPRKASVCENQSLLSSSESLSSDARSKISIKKRSHSPPRTVAPTILPKPASQRTLTLQKQSSSSIDSLNSQQTTRTTSSIRLPTRIIVNNSSSSSSSSCSDEGSSEKSNHYFESNIGPKTSVPTPTHHQTLGRHDSRRMSEVLHNNDSSKHQLFVDIQGQGSNSSDAMALARKGYFRKNNKTRRSDRHLDETTTSPQLL